MKEEPIVKGSNEHTIREKEAVQLSAKIPPQNLIVALDKSGKVLDSEQFAVMISRWEASGKDITLVIGGALGLADSVLDKAAETISLGKMTFTQDLARVVLLEQLFRGFTILRGLPFHK